MMCQIRIRFNDFYSEYGCFLWTVVIIQAISLLIKTAIDNLTAYYTAVYEYYDQCNDVT